MACSTHLEQCHAYRAQFTLDGPSESLDILVHLHIDAERVSTLSLQWQGIYGEAQSDCRSSWWCLHLHNGG